MKTLAFALDPDNYWVEVLQRSDGPQFEAMNKIPYNLSQTMLRVKDGLKSVDFYTKHFGMRLLRRLDFEAAKFSLFFLVSMNDAEFKEAWEKLPEEEREKNPIEKWVYIIQLQ